MRDAINVEKLWGEGGGGEVRLGWKTQGTPPSAVLANQQIIMLIVKGVIQWYFNVLVAALSLQE